MEAKICGVCRPEDAAAAARLGADYIGVILAPNRTRTQTVGRAREIFAAAGPARRVGVFVDPEVAEVERALGELQLDVVQLHGRESVEFARQLRSRVRVWKAVPVGAAGTLVEAVNSFAGAADAVLLDSAAGGTGHSFDWTQAASLRDQFDDTLALVLAGGLTPENVAAAIETVAPDVVDVSSGIESELCIKSGEKMKAFLDAVKKR